MIDEASSVEEGARLECDLCIVGAGAAGITLALQFARSGLRVLLLEGGGMAAHADTQALYAGEVADAALHSPTDTYRQRRFGGTTTQWSGRCVPFDPIDFVARSWIPESGWPISYEDVAVHYPAANALCEAGTFSYGAGDALPGAMRPMIRGFQPVSFHDDRIERFSCPTDFGARYGRRLATSTAIRVLLNANVIRVATRPDGAAVDHLDIRSLAGRSFTVAAQHFVLANGGLEVPRLLLASRDTHADGIGNANGLVGRFYMTHIAGTIGTVTLDVPQADVFNGYEIADDGTYCRRRLALTDAAQEEHRIANAVLRLHMPSIPDPSHGSGPLSALFLARPLLRHEQSRRLHSRADEGVVLWLRHLSNVMREPFATTAFMLNWFRRRTLSARKFPSVIVPSRHNVFSLDYHAEQLPNPDSRVSLGPGTDALGLPRLFVDWRHTAEDIRTASTTLDLLSQDLRRWGHGRLDYEPGSVAHHMLRDGAYGGHHIGTARMGATPASGVVDPECRVHGMANLFIAGPAVFPTSGQANPTLTIVAMALRLAATLKRRFAEAPAEVIAA